MGRQTLHLVMFVLSLAIALPATAQFSEIRRAVDREIGGKQVWIPFKGIARMYVRTAHPDGVRDFQFAVFEDASGAGSGRIESIFRNHLGSEWQPFVRMKSHRDGEEVLIYAREGKGGETMDLMIFAGDSEETVLMLTSLEVERFVEGLDDPGGFASR